MRITKSDESHQARCSMRVTKSDVTKSDESHQARCSDESHQANHEVEACAIPSIPWPFQRPCSFYKAMQVLSKCQGKDVWSCLGSQHGRKNPSS
jgi:hypothetical protein